MRILLFCNDRHHPGHVPIEGMEPLKEKGFTIDVITDTADFDPAIIHGYDVLVMSKNDDTSNTIHSSWKTAAVQDAFVKYVESGGGLLVTHNGTVAGEETDKINRLVGARFIMHPNRCPVTVGSVKPHPVTKNVGMFCEEDEHYRLEILVDDIDIIVTSYAPSQGNVDKYETDPYRNYPAHIAPSGYVRTQGKGRVCVLTPGHLLEVWLNLEFQKLLENGLRWCAGL